MGKRFNPQRYRTEASAVVGAIKTEFAEVVASAFLEMQRELGRETPVLSGALLLGWQASVNEPVLTELKVKEAKKLKYRKKTLVTRIARKEGDVDRHKVLLIEIEAQLKALEGKARADFYQKLKSKAEYREAITGGAKSLHLSNAAPYARRQNNEHRQKANFIERAVEKFKGHIK